MKLRSALAINASRQPGGRLNQPASCYKLRHAGRATTVAAAAAAAATATIFLVHRALVYSPSNTPVDVRLRNSRLFDRMTSRGKMRSRYIRFDLFLPKIKRSRSLYSPSTPPSPLAGRTTSSNFVSNLVAATRPIDGNEINFRSRSSKTYLKPAKVEGRGGGGEEAREGKARKGGEMSPNFEEGRARTSLSDESRG